MRKNYNRRVGARGEQKRRYDAGDRHPCATPGCTALCSRGAKVCLPCRHAQQRVRMVLIQQLWLSGRSSREIADIVGTTPETVQVTVRVMRKNGWDMPKRGPRGKVLT